MLLAAVLWHLAIIPVWTTPVPEGSFNRDAVVNDLMKPFDTDLTFSSEANCHEYVSRSTALGKKNMAEILQKRGLPGYFDAGHTCYPG